MGQQILRRTSVRSEIRAPNPAPAPIGAALAQGHLQRQAPGLCVVALAGRAPWRHPIWVAMGGDGESDLGSNRSVELAALRLDVSAVSRYGGVRQDNSSIHNDMCQLPPDSDSSRCAEFDAEPLTFSADVATAEG
jgi:hypothetical protein